MTDTRYDEARYPVGPASNFQKSSFDLKGRFGRWAKMAEAMLERWSNRRAVYKLSRLDNRQLRDIGLTRADVTWALSLPRDIDPSLELSCLVQRRRDARRWATKFEAV